MSSYDEHLITQAGGDGEPSTSRELTEHQALCIWEDNVGDSGKAPTNLELLTFANAARDPLLTLVREQQARIERVRELHAQKFYDKWGRTSEVPTEYGGWCNICARFDGASCPTVAALEPTP